MFGFSKEEKDAKLMVPQWLKIVTDCRDLINKTVEPDVFFMRYELLKETTAKLAKASKYYNLRAPSPLRFFGLPKSRKRRPLVPSFSGASKKLSRELTRRRQ